MGLWWQPQVPPPRPTSRRTSYLYTWTGKNEGYEQVLCGILNSGTVTAPTATIGEPVTSGFPPQLFQKRSLRTFWDTRPEIFVRSTDSTQRGHRTELFKTPPFLVLPSPPGSMFAGPTATLDARRDTPNAHRIQDDASLLLAPPAMLTGSGSNISRFRPRVHVTLWS